ncbi:MAG: heavy metal transport/detoxification protein [Nitriliruptorales bacterium]|nr:heavy metal transport/detoxification protein [Nitriliruptorales bacterium]
METSLTIAVPEIHCDHCKSSIEGALQPLEGVREASVDIGARTVTMSFDARKIGRGELVTVIESQGYDVPA